MFCLRASVWRQYWQTCASVSSAPAADSSGRRRGRKKEFPPGLRASRRKTQIPRQTAARGELPPAGGEEGLGVHLSSGGRESFCQGLLTLFGSCWGEGKPLISAVDARSFLRRNGHGLQPPSARGWPCDWGEGTPLISAVDARKAPTSPNGHGLRPPSGRG